jgi:hypothetical protein
MADIWDRFYDRLKYHMKFFKMEPPPRQAFSSTLAMGTYFANIAKAAGGGAGWVVSGIAVASDLYLAILAGSAAVAWCEVNNLPLPLELTYTASMRVLKLPLSTIAAAAANSHGDKVRPLRGRRLHTAA